MVLPWETVHRRIVVVAALAVACAMTAWSVELTDNTWEAGVANRSVMVMFYDPSCSHCMDLKPKWDRLAYFYKNKSDAVVVTINCGGNQSDELCKKPAFFPLIQHRSPPIEPFKDYEDGKDWKSLEEFASKTLGAVCTPTFLETCDEVMKTRIQEFQKMTKDELKTAVNATDEAVLKVKNKFEDEIQRLQERINELTINKPRTMEEVAEVRGDYLMRAVLSQKDESFESSVPDDEEEFSMDDLDLMDSMVASMGKGDDDDMVTEDAEEGESNDEDDSSEEEGEDDELPGDNSSEEDTDPIFDMDFEDWGADEASQEADGDVLEGEEGDEVEPFDEKEEDGATDAKNVAPASPADKASGTGDSVQPSTGSGGHSKDEL